MNKPSKKSVIFIDVSKPIDETFSYPDYLKLLKKFQRTINEDKYKSLEYIKFIGDRVMLIFDIFQLGTLLHNVIQIREEFGVLTEELFHHSIPFNLRIGITCGDFSKNEIKYNTQFDYISPTINRAANLCSTVAKPYGIVIDKESFCEEIKKINNNNDSYYEIEALTFYEGLTSETAGGKRIHYLVESIDIERYGLTEIHLAAFIFNDGKLLLEKRNEKEILEANKWATPGGRMISPVPFEEALRHLILDKNGLDIKNIKIFDTYYIDKFKAPGVCFYAETDSIKNIKNKTTMKFYLEEQIQTVDLMENINKETISKSFERNKLESPVKYRVRVVLPHFCNFNCKNCHKEHIQNNISFNIEKIKKIFLNLDSKKCELSHVTITGGEPFHDNNFEHLLNLLEFLRTQYSDKIKISIVTNGYNIDPEKLTKINQYNISLKISLYSTDRKEDKPMEYIGKPEINSSVYFSKIFNILKLVEAFEIKKSLNILINEEDADFDLLIKFLKEQNISFKNIKLMEQIPYVKENKIIPFSSLKIYKQTKDYMQPVDGFKSTKLHTALHGFNILFFRYPCYDSNNCIQCFEKWDLIISSNGVLQVCSRAVEGSKYKNRLNSIPSEMIAYDDYWKRYVEKDF